MHDSVLGIGIDIVEIARIRALVENSGMQFLKKHFTLKEINDCNKKVNRYEHFAGKFAAKEAAYKALLIRRGENFNWKNIQILNDEDGEPRIELSGVIEKGRYGIGSSRILVSISHCKEYAAAVVLITGEDNHDSN